MEKYILTKNDYEQIEKIIKTSLSIETLYKRLYALELDGKKDTEEYKINLDYLSIAKEVEEKEYSDFNLTEEKAKAWANYLLSDKLPSTFLQNVDSLVEQNYANITLRRILSNLINITEESVLKDQLPKELVDIMKLVGIDDADKVISDAAISCSELRRAFEVDLINAYLYILNEQIEKNNHFKESKECLMSAKYNAIFINREIENQMLFREFSIPELVYFTSKIIADKDNMKDDMYKHLRNEYGKVYSVKQISEMLEIGDLDYNNVSLATTSLLRQCLMRASFLLMSDDSISDVNYNFHEFIEDERYLKNHRYDKISEQLIINCFNCIKKDRKNVDSVSLKYKPF